MTAKQQYQAFLASEIGTLCGCTGKREHAHANPAVCKSSALRGMQVSPGQGCCDALTLGVNGEWISKLQLSAISIFVRLVVGVKVQTSGEYCVNAGAVWYRQTEGLHPNILGKWW